MGYKRAKYANIYFASHISIDSCSEMNIGETWSILLPSTWSKVSSTKNLFPEKQGTCWELHLELQSICLKDDIYLKTSSKSNFGWTDRYIFKFFLEGAPIFYFCCATNQSNPRILKVCLVRSIVSFTTLWKILLVGIPHTPNFYPLAPPLRNFHWPSGGGGGGYGYFLESHIPYM